MDKKKVLIVDDEKDVCELISDILKKVGYQTLIAFAGKEGLQKVMGERPDLVLLDIILPDMDGFEVLRKLKYSAETQAVPVVIVSGRRDTASMFKANDLRSDDYITKPFTSQDLLKSVKRCIGMYTS